MASHDGRGAIRTEWLVHRPARWLRVLVLGAAVAAALAGCATVPSSGAAQSLAGNNGQQQAFVQPLPPPGPNAGWTNPEDVIYGFLHASASFALDPNAAQQFLAPGMTRPRYGPVTVISTVNFKKGTSAFLSARTGSPIVDTFEVTGQRVASLGSAGQYLTQAGTTGPYSFRVAKYDGVWRIVSLPKLGGSSLTPLLLFQSDFQQVYQPANLYFFAEKSPSDLVPDPVYVPVQGAKSAPSTSDLARRLVNGLINGLQGIPAASWLSGATSTAFPIGTRVLGVTVSNLTATVDLGGGPIMFAGSTAMNQMYAQLRETLTSQNTDLPPLASSVRLKFDGVPFHVGRAQYSVPPVGSAGEPLYFASGGAVYAQPPGGKRSQVAGPDQLGFVPDITAVAASRSPRPQLAVAIPSGQGCAVELPTIGSIAPGAAYTLSRTGGPCSSLSWDNSGDLWVAAGSRVWVLQHGQLPQQVQLPSFGAGQATPTVLALRIAPDGVRAALLVRASGGNKLFLSAVSYSGGKVPAVSFGPAVPLATTGLSGSAAGPTAMSWDTPYYLAVLDGSELFQVPLAGGLAQSVEPVPTGTVSVSTNDDSTASGSVVAVGTASGRILLQSGEDGTWSAMARGTVPAFPG